MTLRLLIRSQNFDKDVCMHVLCMYLFLNMCVCSFMDSGVFHVNICACGVHVNTHACGGQSVSHPLGWQL